MTTSAAYMRQYRQTESGKRADRRTRWVRARTIDILLSRHPDEVEELRERFAAEFDKAWPKP